MGNTAPLGDEPLTAIVERFELAWRANAVPVIEEYLPTPTDDATPQACREVLIELIKVDLEYRWRYHHDNPVGEDATASHGSAESLHGSRPQRMQLEDYVNRYWQLVRDSGHFPLDLVAEEYRVRQIWGDRPNREEYFARFSAIQDQLRSLLDSVDSDLKRLAIDSHDNRAADQSTLSRLTARSIQDSDYSHVGNRFGNYVAVELVGQGAFGSVYRAINEALGLSVAIKVPHGQNASKDVQQKFLDEARAMASLRHAGIVSIYDVGVTIDGQAYVVMEFVRGRTLRDRLSQSGGRLPLRAAVDIAVEVGKALHTAHKRGFVHRDIKPSNILIDDDDAPRVADFGLALHDNEQRAHRGELAGTLPYMAPEQVRGEAQRLDGRADIWALGVVLYEMLTGRRPFCGSTTDEVCDEILHREPKPLRQIDDSIPASVESICLKAMSKSVLDRFSTALDLSDALSRTQDKTADESPDAALISLVWKNMSLELQEAFLKAYTAKVLKGSHRISTQDLIDAMLRTGDGDIIRLKASLPEGAVVDSRVTGRTAARPERTDKPELRGTFMMNDDFDASPLSDASEELLDVTDPSGNPGRARASRRLSWRELLLGRKREAPQVKSSPPTAALLSDCVAETLRSFQNRALSRLLSPSDVFVDIAKHGHGPSVARLRQYEVTAETIEHTVERLGLDILRRDA